jgi:acyl-CoA thioesterase-1
MAIVYCFGDSITYGAWDIERGGWANRLRNHLDDLQLKDSSLYYLCYNLGIPGDTTDGLAERFDIELAVRKRHDKGEESIFVFAFGANDSVFKPTKNDFSVPIDRFVANMDAVIRKASAISQKIILVNILPCDEAILADRYIGKDKVRLNSNVEAYNKALATFAADRKLPLVDVYSEYVKRDFKLLLSEDGLHPNEKGHEVIFQEVKDSLTPFF